VLVLKSNENKSVHQLVRQSVRATLYMHTDVMYLDGRV